SPKPKHVTLGTKAMANLACVNEGDCRLVHSVVSESEARTVDICSASKSRLQPDAASRSHRGAPVALVVPTLHRRRFGGVLGLRSGGGSDVMASEQCLLHRYFQAEPYGWERPTRHRGKQRVLEAISDARSDRQQFLQGTGQ